VTENHTNISAVAIDFTCAEFVGEPCIGVHVYVEKPRRSGAWLSWDETVRLRDFVVALVGVAELPSDAMHDIANQRARECMAAIGREAVMGAAGWKFGTNPQDFIREAIMNALMDATAVREVPFDLSHRPGDGA
jgi:hypothetical protein